ncbi:hypothetical protein M0805_002012 [Coniferiporia weirii]|nr:hypothetical protein M0805_002012 [Coniferiporia weirii]
MYPLCARRALCRSLLRARPSQLPRRYLTVEHDSSSSDSAAADAPPVFAADAESQVHARHDAGPSSSLLDFVGSIATPRPSEDAPASDRPSTAKKPTKAARRPPPPQTRSVLIQPDGGVKSMPAALAIVQEVERRFGKVREFRIVQDKDVRTDYLPFIFVNFESYDSVKRIHELDNMYFSFHFEPWNRDKLVDGGVALEDIKDYLRPASVKDDLSFAKSISSVEAALATSTANDASIEAEAIQDASVKELASPELAVEQSSTQLTEDGEEPVFQTGKGPKKPVDDQNPENEIVCRLETMNAEGSHNIMFQPVRFPLHRIPEMHRGKRIFMAHALISWGGFYPAYDFRNESTEFDRDTTSSENVESPDAALETYDNVKVATRAMRSSLIRQRLRLKHLGDPLHGLVEVGGQPVVKEWLADSVQPSREPVQRAKEEISADELQADVRVVPGLKQEEQYKVLNGEEGPATLSKEEEESFERLLVRMNRTSTRETGRRSERSGTTKGSSRKRTSRASSPSTIASSPPSSSPPPVTTSTSPAKRTSPDAPARASEAHTSSRDESDSHSYNHESSNNRARRQARKAEEEKLREQSNFKNRLLGWVRSSLR